MNMLFCAELVTTIIGQLLINVRYATKNLYHGTLKMKVQKDLIMNMIISTCFKNKKRMCMKKLLYLLFVGCIYQQSICMNSNSSFWVAITTSSSSESSPLLHDACEEGNVEQLKQLLTQPHIDVNAFDGDDTPLYLACKNNHLACVK